MADAWNGAWASSWGTSWGAGAGPPPEPEPEPEPAEPGVRTGATGGFDNRYGGVSHGRADYEERERIVKQFREAYEQIYGRAKESRATVLEEAAIEAARVVSPYVLETDAALPPPAAIDWQAILDETAGLFDVLQRRIAVYERWLQRKAEEQRTLELLELQRQMAELERLRRIRDDEEAMAVLLRLM